MKHIGIYTGKIYDDIDLKDIYECAIQIFPEDDIEEVKKRQNVRRLMLCAECNDCEESRRRD